MMSNDKKLKEAQETLLIILKEIDRICTKHSIHYYLDGGTLIGAVRHKGFIPWDDDIDVCFLREEYEKFLSVIEEDTKNSDFKFVNHKTNEKFHDNIDRLFYLNKKYREGEIYRERFGGIFQYLWVDFFVVDEVPKRKALFEFRKQQIIYGLLMGHRIDKRLKKQKSTLATIGVHILSFIGKMIPLKTLYELQEKSAKKYYQKNLKYIYYTNWPTKLCLLDKNLLFKTKYVDFEDAKMPVPIGYDTYLKKWYGDYLKLPKEEDRVPSHQNII